MALWHWLLGVLPSPLMLYIGVVVGAVFVLWVWRDRGRTVMTHDDRGVVDPNEHKRRADYLAADAARLADARISPHQGGFNF